MRRRLAILAVAGALGMGWFPGCNRGQDPTIGASDTTAPTTAGDTATTAAPEPAGVAPPVSVAPVRERAHLTAVRVDTKDGGASRVVLEFDPVVPGYKIDLTTRPVTMDGSGDQVRVTGEELLEVVLENASQARFEGERVVRTYTGPGRVVPTGDGTGAVIEVVEAGDFEGVVRWVLGLRHKGSKIEVRTLTGPARLVVDVRPPD